MYEVAEMFKTSKLVLHDSMKFSIIAKHFTKESHMTIHATEDE